MKKKKYGSENGTEKRGKKRENVSRPEESMGRKNKKGNKRRKGRGRTNDETKRKGKEKEEKEK